MKESAKYANLGVFTGNIVLDGEDAMIMVATFAGDLVINHPIVQLIANCELREECLKLV